jgi:hypothetical protein
MDWTLPNDLTAEASPQQVLGRRKQLHRSWTANISDDYDKLRRVANCAADSSRTMSAIHFPRALSPLRFSLRGLFLLMLSLSAGLAWYRLPGSTSAQFLYGCFGSWFVIGMVEQSLAAWKMRRECHQPSAAQWTGWAMAVADPLAIAALFLFSALCDIAIRADWFELRGDRDTYDQFSVWIMRRLTDTLLCFAIVCGYWPGGPAEGERRLRKSWRDRLNAGISMAAGGVLLILMLLSTAAVFNMAHTALAQMIDYQPTRWTGHDFVPARLNPPGLQRAFVWGGLLGMALIAAASAMNVMLARRWQKGVATRCLLAVLVAGLLASAVGLLLWCQHSALPALSPLTAESLSAQPVVNLGLAMVLIVSLATAASRRAVQHTADNTASVVQSTAEPTTPTHLFGITLLLGMTALAWDTIATWIHRDRIWMWYTWSDISYNQIEPDQLIQAAAFMLLAAAFWRVWRGLPPRPVRIWAVCPTQLATVWFFFAIALVLTPAIGAWFGLALFLQAGLR